MSTEWKPKPNSSRSATALLGAHRSATLAGRRKPQQNWDLNLLFGHEADQNARISRMSPFESSDRDLSDFRQELRQRFIDHLLSCHWAVSLNVFVNFFGMTRHHFGDAIDPLLPFITDSGHFGRRANKGSGLNSKIPDPFSANFSANLSLFLQTIIPV